MAFELPDLPWAPDALEPVISARTIELHHGKHHRAYVDALNRLIASTAYEGVELEEVLIRSSRAGDTAVANNAGQHFAHSLYWRSLSQGATSAPPRFAEQLAKDFGDLDTVGRLLADAAGKHFGSGWAWLSWTGDKLSIETTLNARTPIEEGRRPLLVIDVWEHAYYLDWQNRRAAYLEALKSHLNWADAGVRFAEAAGHTT